MAFNNSITRKHKGREKSCVAAPSQVVFKILGKKVILPIGAIGGGGGIGGGRGGFGGRSRF